jgi:hypothetical protein
LGISVSTGPNRFGDASAWNPLMLITDPTPTRFQVASCYLYLVSMLAALIVWVKLGFEVDPDKIVSIIPELSRTLTGVAVGALAIVLNR